jgi:hypothetical protein
MKTFVEEKTVYLFEELPVESQQKALEEYWGINVNYEWWDFTYEDAKNIGLEITEFDLDRNRHAKGDFINSALETAEKILENHGDICETYKTAKDYLEARTNLVKKYSDGVNTEQVLGDNEYNFDNECDEIDEEFLRSLLEDYSIILQKESEYLTSEEVIKETLIANEYEFTIDGKIY